MRARVCTTRYDSITDQYSQFLLDDVLPALETTAGLKISSNPEARGLVGIYLWRMCLCSVLEQARRLPQGDLTRWQVSER